MFFFNFAGLSLLAWPVLVPGIGWTRSAGSVWAGLVLQLLGALQYQRGRCNLPRFLIRTYPKQWQSKP